MPTRPCPGLSGGKDRRSTKSFNAAINGSVETFAPDVAATQERSLDGLASQCPKPGPEGVSLS